MKKVDFQKTKIEKVGKSATILSVSRIMNLMISLVSSMILARVRTLTEYGTFSEITTVVSIAVAIFCIGLPSTINFFVPRCNNQQERNEFLSFYYFINTALGSLIGVILLLTTPFIAAYYKNDQIFVFSYALALLPLTNILLKGRDNLLVATNQSVRLLVYNLLQTITNLCIIVFVQLTQGSFELYFILYIIDNVIFSVLVYFEASRLIDRVHFSINKKMFKELLQYSIPLGISGAIATIDIDLDKLIIGYLFDADKVAIYANCGRELPIVYIASSFSAVLLPVAVRKVKDSLFHEAVDLWKTTIEFSMFIVAFFASACITMAPQVITVLYSEKYLTGVSIFRVYSLVLLLRITAFGLMLNALGQTKEILKISLISLLANFLLNLLAYHLFGFVGPAIATFVTMLCTCLLLLNRTALHLKISFSSLFPWRKCMTILLLNAVLGFIVYQIVSILGVTTDNKGVVICVGIGIMWLIVYYLLIRKRFVELWRKMNAIK